MSLRRAFSVLLVLLVTALAGLPISAATALLPDPAAPTTTDDVPADYRTSPVVVTLTATDDALGSGVASTTYAIVAADGTPGAARDYASDGKPVLQDGELVRYFSTDAAGNAEAPHDSAAAKVDGAAPATTDDVPSGYQPGPFTVTLSAVDAGSSGVASTTYAIVGSDGVAGQPTAYDASAKPTLGDGEMLRYFSTDLAGNVEGTHDSPMAHVDTSVPDTTITEQPGAVTRDPRPSVSFTSHAPTDRFECSLDGGAFAGCTSPYRPAQPLSDGDHTLRVRAVNRANVVDASPAAASFVVDTAPVPEPKPVEPQPKPPVPDPSPTEPQPSPTEPPAAPAPPAPASSPATVPEAATAARAVLGPRALTIATAGRIGVGCATDRGPLRSCVARIVDARGTVLAEGAAAFVGAPGTSMRVVLLRTGAGRVALRRQPSGVPAFLDLLVTTPDGRTLTGRSPTTLLASDRIVVLVDPTRRLGAAARQQIAALARTYANARAVTCTAYTDRRSGTSAGRAAALTRAQARAACALAARAAPKAKTIAQGRGRRSPVASNRTAAGRARNRRIVLTFG